MIKPTVGRVVLFWPSIYYARQQGMAFGDPAQPLAALVTYVHGDRMVNLTVHDHNGVVWPVCSVQLLQEGDAPVVGGSFYCEWMPYQKGQAAKTEELEKAVSETTPIAAGSVERVRLFLNRGSLVKINGIPVELEHDAVVLVHAGNVPLLSAESVNACETKLDS